MAGIIIIALFVLIVIIAFSAEYILLSITPFSKLYEYEAKIREIEIKELTLKKFIDVTFHRLFCFRLNELAVTDNKKLAMLQLKHLSEAVILKDLVVDELISEVKTNALIVCLALIVGFLVIIGFNAEAKEILAHNNFLTAIEKITKVAVHFHVLLIVELAAMAMAIMALIRSRASVKRLAKEIEAWL